MLTVLILDDNPRKIETIKQASQDAVAAGDIEFSVASSVHAAAEQLRSRAYDLLILDLSVPMRDGEEVSSDAGIRVLRELSRKQNQYYRPTYIFGLTAFEDLEARYRSEFAADTWYLAFYSENSIEWRLQLSQRLNYVWEVKRGLRDALGYKTDLAIITALHRIELEAVLDLPAGWRRVQINDDESFCHKGTFSSSSGSLSVVACAAEEMGMPASAALSMKIIEAFRPRYIVMCGIAAGIGGTFGDILIADHSWDYGSGKQIRDRRKGSIFLPGPSQLQIDAALKNWLNIFLLKQEVLTRIRDRWNGNPAATNFTARMGHLASGAAVLQDKAVIDQIRAHNRLVIGVEMEVYGVFYAARIARTPRPRVLAIKSVCDFGDKKKNDEYQRFAAFTSAQFLFEFALDQLVANHADGSPTTRTAASLA